MLSSFEDWSTNKEGTNGQNKIVWVIIQTIR
ncbi:hypothetical protein SAMN04515679_1175 [Pelosinus fermentans]|jgi:hypothetical protein|uniref:Uncharacterized protein n=1 Tax=Pelosinus fermentans B4 TaxID=1149862 RepID=I9LHU5_9FIRM|nr:hypothetical protein FB4_2526 [Pelosinus fermentans B4]EIW26161.1 hypothetical protein FA11_2000 [Pelosinus fermentans A11]OAM93100.1 hypothetical protein FR7_01116 [Pelosinus fermentans DSM 17108]SDQ67096.1 hypothetical protein SAMN04515679_1175 [Pelosinus fermentans]